MPKVWKTGRKTGMCTEQQLKGQTNTWFGFVDNARHIWKLFYETRQRKLTKIFVASYVTHTFNKYTLTGKYTQHKHPNTH